MTNFVVIGVLALIGLMVWLGGRRSYFCSDPSETAKFHSFCKGKAETGAICHHYCHKPPLIGIEEKVGGEKPREAP